MRFSFENKWTRGALPALFIHCCIGSVYCWSLLKGDIAARIGCETSSIEMAFSLAIFFLGMSAAFAGRFVERSVKKAALLSCFCFVSGLLGTVYAMRAKSVPLLFLSYGCVMGIGLGVGYLAPVKTFMLWFREHKGLATGIAISGFGLSKALFSPFITWCGARYGVEATLASMAAVSVVFMLAAAALIRKPAGWTEDSEKFTVSGALKIILNPTYLMIWLAFYLNITCGLALIAYEKDLGMVSGITAVGALASLTAVFNTLGRFGYSTASDWVGNKARVYSAIFASEFAVVALALVFGTHWLIVAAMLCVVNAGYGGGFSTLPTFLQSRFGMKKISMIHGFALSAWGWAGLSGNQLSNFVLNKCHGTFSDLFIVLGVLYLLAFGVVTLIPKKTVVDD